MKKYIAPEVNVEEYVLNTEIAYGIHENSTTGDNFIVDND